MPLSQKTAECTLGVSASPLHSALCVLTLCQSTLLTLVSQTFHFPGSSHLTESNVILKSTAFSITGRILGLIDGSLMTPMDHQCLTDGLTERHNCILTLHGLFCTTNGGHSSLIDCHREQSVLFSNLPGYRETEMMVPFQLPFLSGWRLNRKSHTC